MAKSFILVLTALLLASLASFGQDSYIELMRSDVQTQKKAIITEAMEFTEEEAAAFWPVYNDYANEFRKIGDEKIAMIKDYAANFDNITDEKAKELMDKAFNLEERTTKLKKKYYKKLSKVLPVTRTARFFQLENQLINLINLQVASELPLME
jgi:hypothetical protein